jgi:sugar transferase (PEP-CTERM/EpsH1 system associated)
MKIVYVTQIVPYPPHGGVLQRGFNLLRELGRRHVVRLIAFHHPDELPHGDAFRKSQEELGRFCAEVEYLPLWPKRSAAHKLAAFAMAAAHPKPFSVLAHRSGQLSRRLRQLTSAKERPDVVHLDTIALSPYRADCGSVPVVLTHHNVESQLMERRAEIESTALARWYVGLQARRLRTYEAAESRHFPVNVMVSDADAALLRSICPEARTAVIPNGVDVEYFVPRRDEESPAVIYTGGMNMFANRDAVDWFVESIWPRIISAVPEVRFLAVGQRPTTCLLEAAASDDRIEVPGFVPDVRPWVARAAVYVVPLRVGGGTRLKMVDAMAQGKAIVATTVGAEGIHGEDGRHFVIADEPERFAAEVVRLIRDAATRRELGAAARERVEAEYGWPMLAERLVGIYESVIAGGRP